MWVKQEFQEPKAPEDFRKIELYFEDFCDTYEQLGLSGYLTSARIYLKGYSSDKEQQGSKLKGLSKQRRVFQGIL